jgi:hypothetical protein
VCVWSKADSPARILADRNCQYLRAVEIISRAKGSGVTTMSPERGQILDRREPILRSRVNPVNGRQVQPL